jgi:hypothetical protein
MNTTSFLVVHNACQLRGGEASLVEAEIELPRALRDGGRLAASAPLWRAGA